MNYYIDEIDIDYTIAFDNDSFVQLVRSLHIYAGLALLVYGFYEMFLNPRDEDESQSGDDDESQSGDDDESQNDESQSGEQDESQNDEQDESQNDSSYSSEDDIFQFKLPAVLHINTPDQRTQGETDNIAYALMSHYGIYNSQASDRPSSLYYNYHGDYYIIFCEQPDYKIANALWGQSLTDELQERYDISLDYHSDDLIEFPDTSSMITYCQEAILYTVEKTIKNLYENEIDYNVPSSILNCASTLCANDIEWDILPEANIYGKWIKISLSNNTGGYNMIDFPGFMLNSTIPSSFTDFVEATELPVWYYCQLVDQIKFDTHTQFDREDDTEDESSDDSMPELVTASDEDNSPTNYLQRYSLRSVDTKCEDSASEAVESSDQEESSSTSTDDDMPDLESVSSDEVCKRVQESEPNFTSGRRISKRRSSFGSDRKMRTDFLKMKELLENLRNNKKIVVNESPSE
jgi:hypothetical protein